MKTYRYLALLLLAVSYLVYSCGGGSGLPSSTGGGTTTTTGASDPASITLTATPSSLTVQGTSSVSATVLDSSGSSVTDGTAVTFASTSGTISGTATTASGVATTTFTASSTAGIVTITGTAGSVSNTVNVTVTAPSTGSIEFTSATPTVIGIKGSGQTETSLIKFTINDVNGNAVTDGTSVDFVMSGPSGGKLPANGGEYIGEQDTTPTTASASTVSGEASVYLNSGAVAGPVIIVATVSGTSMSSASTPLSIGGGVPNDAHLTVVTDRLNLEGLGWANIKANISVFMADRFGNFNVLEGTSVSFYAESGAIDRNDVTDSTGSTSVVFRTQSPVPENVIPIDNDGCSGGPPTSANDAVVNYSSEWEDCLIAYVSQTKALGGYNISTTRHPRDGWATILVSTRGEEAFNDANANGIYNAGETFSDTPQEAFIDINDDDSRDDDGSVDPFEDFIDDDGDSAYDGANGSWDSDKTIFKDIKLLITGSPYYIVTRPGNNFSVANGSSETFTLLIADINLNPPIGGTTVSISTDAGELAGTTSYTFPDVFSYGPIELSFVLKDNDADTTSELATITIKVTYTPTDGTSMDYYLLVSGTVI